MIFTELSIPGVYTIAVEPRQDARGTFARVFCADEFGALGLNTHWAQMNVSVTQETGTLRGMHFQRPPHSEVKVVRATRGEVHDVIVDLRAGSPTFGRHLAVRLSATQRNAIYIPQGVAHGFQTLTDDSELFYMHSTPYTPGAEGGVQALDPALGINWPLPVTLRSPRDETLPPLSEIAPL